MPAAPAVCTVPDCGEPVGADGPCPNHVCATEGCDRAVPFLENLHCVMHTCVMPHCLRGAQLEGGGICQTCMAGLPPPMRAQLVGGGV